VATGSVVRKLLLQHGTLSEERKEIQVDRPQNRSVSAQLAWLRANPPLKVLTVYVASSMAGLGQVDLITARLGAPDWVFNVAVVLAVVGLFVVLLLAAALKRGVTLGRFLRVIVGGMALGWFGVALADLAVDTETLPVVAYSTAVLLYLTILPLVLSGALLWRPRRSKG